MWRTLKKKLRQLTKIFNTKKNPWKTNQKTRKKQKADDEEVDKDFHCRKEDMEINANPRGCRSK